VRPGLEVPVQARFPAGLGVIGIEVSPGPGREKGAQPVQAAEPFEGEAIPTCRICAPSGTQPRPGAGRGCAR
jgi:hypothetical protein